MVPQTLPDHCDFFDLRVNEGISDQELWHTMLISATRLTGEAPPR